MMATGNDMYDESCPVQSINEESADDDADEVMYEDLLDSNDLVTAQLASAGPVGLAAAAAIASGKKRRRLHSFETNPSIRKRQQTRLLRKLFSLMEEYIVRVGQQAVFVCCSQNKLNQNGSFRVYGSQPLEGIVKGRRSNVVNDLEELMSRQANQLEVERLDLFELPPLSVEGVPTTLERMTQAQLRYFIPEMLKYATGKSKPGWSKPECRPVWWPDDVPWANVRSDVRDEESKKETSWTLALRKIVRSCYKHHNREELLDSSAPQSHLVSSGRVRYNPQTIVGGGSTYVDELSEGKASSIVVEQVTNPDGSIRIVQLDTSALSNNLCSPMATVVRQQAASDAQITIKEEIQELQSMPSILTSEIPNSQKKIIRLTRKRSCPPGTSHSVAIPFPSCLRTDGSDCSTGGVGVSSATLRGSATRYGTSFKLEGSDYDVSMGRRN